MNNFPAMTEDRQKQLLQWIKPRLSELETLCDDMPFGLDEDDQIFMEVMQTARKMLSGQSVSPDGWIKCSERYPEEGQEVLIRIPVCEKFNIENGKYEGDGRFLGAWFDTRGKGRPYKVTHWMPLPPPPEASNEQ